MSKEKNNEMKAVSPFSFKPSSICFEHPAPGSMTVPGQSMSMQEIYKRFVSGMAFETKEAIWEDSEDDDEFDPTRSPDFDLTDIPVYVQRIEERKKAAAEQAAQQTKGGVRGDDTTLGSDITPPVKSDQGSAASAAQPATEGANQPAV